MKIRSLTLVVIIILMLMCFLTSCTVPAKSEDDIITDLQNHPNFYSVQEINIEKLSIIKRQTNVEDKNDIIYVDVKASNDNITCSLSYIMQYTLYNDGWILDDVSAYNTEAWSILPLTAPSPEDAENYVKEYYSYLFLEEKLDFENKSSSFLFSVEEQHKYLLQEKVISVNFEFDSESAAWKKSAITTSNITGKWNIAGNWFGDGGKNTISGYNWYRNYIFQITNVTESSAHIKIYNKENNYVYCDKDISLSPQNGASFVANPSAGWDALDIRITPDRLYISGRGTRSGCDLVFIGN